MLAVNLPVCQYTGMPGQSSSNIANSNLNNNNNTSTNSNNNVSCNNTSGNQHNSNINNNNNNTSTSIGNSHHTLVTPATTNSNSLNNSNISNNISTSSINNISNVFLNSSGSIGGSNNIISNNGGHANAHNIGGLVGGGTSTAAAKNQLEQLNTMREALFSQDGWGCQHVNQDTNWEVPSSPEPANKDPSGPPMWKPTINNGTDLWESNLRNGGQPTTQPVQKTPWGHTPSTNLGGTWGEDDDCTDASNVWTGGPAGPGGASVGVTGVTSGPGATGPTNGPQWGQGSVGVGVSGAGVQSAVAAPSSIAGVAPGGASNAGGVNVPGTSGAGGASGAGNGWGDPRGGAMGGGGPLDMRSVDPRDPMRAASAGDPRDLRMLDPRDPIRGDPRGISGRLNGTSEMWGQHNPIAQHQMPGLNKMGVGGPNVGAGNIGGVPGSAGMTGPTSVGGINAAGNAVGSQWGAPPQSVVGAPKDMVGSMAPKPPGGGTGWEEPSPPPQRRNIPNYDDGTSLWGQQTRVPGGVGVGGGGGSHWKDISDPLNPRNHLMRNAMVGQNASNAGIVSNLGAGGGAPGNVSAAGTGGVGNAVNPINPMSVGAVGPPGARLVSAINGPGGLGGPHKPDNGMWPHPTGPPNVPATGVGSNRNTGGWGDVENHNVVGSAGPGVVSGNVAGNWGDDKTNQTVNNMGQAGNTWNDLPNASAWSKSNQAKIPGVTSSAGWGSAVTTVNAGANDGNDMNPNDWTTTAPHNTIMSKAQQQQQKLVGGATVNLGGINSDLIKQSKQYRMLVEAGFKKDDVERALINANMNLDEATEILRSNLTMVNASGSIDNWRRHDDTLGSYADHNAAVAAAGGSFPGRYAAGGNQPPISFPPNNLLNSMGGGSVGASGGNNPQLNSLNSMQPLQVQKYLNQGPHNVGAAGPQSVNAAAAAVAFGQGSNVAAVNAAAAAAAVTNCTNQPSTQQLRMLVQQIQLAVHSGYLSSQILNQPLAPTTLLLLNQLLSNIKHLQGAQQSLARSGNNGNTLLAIAKYKQQIQNLQNQINAQQAIYIKQHQALQPSPHPAATHINNTNNEYLRSHEAISALQGNFSEMNLNKSGGYQGVPNQQSRLNQWKLPVLDKDITTDSTDFSRAPGATKQVGGLTTNNASNMGPLGLQGDGTWSTGRNINDGWPDPTNDSENKDWSVGQASTATAYTDLVQEFEPGKPWKGSQIKSIEDDPSITPGSVARSPLSINPTPKDADIFSNAASKNSPTDLPSLGLTSSSTWSFNPSSSNQNFPSWSDNTQQEIWSSMNKTSRGPPPGLGSSKSGSGGGGVSNVTNPGNANGWLGGGGRTSGGWSGTNSNWNSNWLLLKNLTAQIDSSTLRTLCMQHGPLLNFHLYLNQGIALCKYATREEASKAQMTLNNCFLGNTTIIAESPSENEVHSILHHLPQQNTNTTATQQQQQQQAQQGQASSHSNTGAVNNAGGGGGGSSNTNANNVNNAGSQNSSTPGGNVNGVNPQSNNPSNNASNVNSVNNGSNNANSGQNGNQPSNHNSHSNSNTANSAATNSNAATNNPSNANTNTGWRSTAQQQQQQTQNSQTRPTGGRDDFEFISKYVCSIVDD